MNPRLLVIDNYDSFTFNLVQHFRELGSEVTVIRNDAITIEAIRQDLPDALVISPGPGRPDAAGISLAAIKEFSGSLPVLGVCLGHQAIAHAFGGTITHAKTLMHGKTSEVEADGTGLFSGFKKPFSVMRYHSLVVDEKSLPESLQVTARSEDGEIMGLRHKTHATEGIQFHPESIMTPRGKKMLRNFIESIEPRKKVA